MVAPRAGGRGLKYGMPVVWDGIKASPPAQGGVD